MKPESDLPPLIVTRGDGVPLPDQSAALEEFKRQCLASRIEQGQLMKVDPADGTAKPYPSHAGQWRTYHGRAAWLFNPWTGARRGAGDVGSDVFGHLIAPPATAK